MSKDGFEDFFGESSDSTPIEQPYSDTTSYDTSSNTDFSSGGNEAKKGGCLIPAIIFFIFLKWIGII